MKDINKFTHTFILLGVFVCIIAYVSGNTSYNIYMMGGGMFCMLIGFVVEAFDTLMEILNDDEGK